MKAPFQERKQQRKAYNPPATTEYGSVLYLTQGDS